MTLETNAGAAPAAAETPSAAQSETPAPQPTMRESLEAIWEKHNNQPRAQDGKFAAAAQEKSAAVETPAPEEPEAVETDVQADAESDQPEEQAKSEPAAPAIAAPNSWPADKKAHWDKVPPDLRGYLAEREAAAHRAFTQNGELVRTIQPFSDLATRYREDFERHGVSPAAGIDAVLAANARVERNPVDGIAWLCGLYQVDPAQLAEYMRSPNQPHPEVLALRRELDGVKSNQAAVQRAQEDAVQAEVSRFVSEFSSGRADFDAVRPLMAALFESGAAETLEDAYSMAVRAHPETSKRIAAEAQKAADDQRKAEEARRAAEAAKKAAEAKKAASLNVRSNGGSNPAAPRTMRESMEAVWDRLNS